MDPQTDLPDLVEDLEVNIDELTETLQPLLSTPLHSTASSLPLLDKAKLYVLAAYSIESLLFSSLQANGVNAKEHAIFAELARLKGYYGKIKDAEERDLKPKARLDVGAAQRFIKHGLSGNEKFDLERAERLAKERARAALKAKLINRKFDDGEGVDGKVAGATTTAQPKKRGVEEMSSESSEDEDADAAAGPVAKRPHTSSGDSVEGSSAPSTRKGTPSKKSKKDKKRDKKGKRSKENTDSEQQQMEGVTPSHSDAAHSKKKDKKKKKEKKKPNETRFQKFSEVVD